MADMRRFMDTEASGVNKRLANFVGFSGLEGSAVNIAVVCHTTPLATRDWGGWRQRLLLGLRDAVLRQGAGFHIPSQLIVPMPTSGASNGGGSAGPKAAELLQGAQASSSSLSAAQLLARN